MPRFIVNLSFEKPEAKKMLDGLVGDANDPLFLKNAVKPVEGYLKMIGVKIESVKYENQDN